MWVLKFEIDGSESLFGKIAKKFNINLTGYPISSYEKDKQLFVNIVATLSGEEKNKKKLIAFIKKDKHILNLEEKDNFLVLLVKEDYSFKPFYNPHFVHINPVLVDKEGKYLLHIASWDRKKIEQLINFASKIYRYKLIKIKQEKIENISLIGLQPNLTQKQKRVYELAVESGYYEYPKKITLDKLAKISNLSYSTFQQHLKYAEKKINNFFLGKY